MYKKTAQYFVVACLFLGISQAASAATDKIQAFWDETKISGWIRSYYFIREHTNPAKHDQPAFSLGGKLGIVTGSFLGGFKIGAAFYTAQSLGLNNDNPKKADISLPSTSLNALGEAYLQYSRGSFLIRGGDQLIETPWLHGADTRMIPAAYRGFFGSWSPTTEWTISALRIYAFKSRVASDFSATTIYTPANQGTPTFPGLDSKKTDGARAVGVNYKTDAIAGQVWVYQFFDFAKMFYGDVQYTFKNRYDINPLIGVQGFVERGDGSNILEKVAFGKADSQGYGALIGVEMPRGRLTLAYNHIAASPDAYNYGGIVSPYTFASDPLYTTSMIAGMTDKTVGDAYKLAGVLYMFDKQLRLTASRALYFTEPFMKNTKETDLDVLYSFKKSRYKTLQGLSLRGRLGIMTGDTARGTFNYYRFMLEYAF